MKRWRRIEITAFRRVTISANNNSSVASGKLRAPADGSSETGGKGSLSIKASKASADASRLPASGRKRAQDQGPKT